jgi:hypothetical protein
MKSIDTVVIHNTSKVPIDVELTLKQRRSFPLFPGQAAYDWFSKDHSEDSKARRTLGATASLMMEVGVSGTYVAVGNLFYQVMSHYFLK